MRFTYSIFLQRLILWVAHERGYLKGHSHFVCPVLDLSDSVSICAIN